MNDELHNLKNALKEAVRYEHDCCFHEDCAHCDALHMIKGLAAHPPKELHPSTHTILCAVPDSNWRKSASLLLKELERYNV